MGIIPDKSIQVLRKAGFGGPLHIRIGSTTEIAIRRQEAEMIKVRL
jgi:ferrous iron transport protein A